MAAIYSTQPGQVQPSTNKGEPSDPLEGLFTPSPSPEPELPVYTSLWANSIERRRQAWPKGEGDEAQPPRYGSVRSLWMNEWRPASHKGMFPFQDGVYSDVKMIFQQLIKNNVDDPNSAEFTVLFMPRSQELILYAVDALQRGSSVLGNHLYLRAVAILRVSRYPWITPEATPLKKQAWDYQKEVYLKAASFWASPLEQITIPHLHASPRPADDPIFHTNNCSTAAGPSMVTGAAFAAPAAFAAAATATAAATPAAPASTTPAPGAQRAGATFLKRVPIPVYVRMPPSARISGQPCPTILVVTDDFTTHTQLSNVVLQNGWATVIVGAPGAPDCPIPEADGEEAADALWSSVFDWMRAMHVFDMDNVMAWGLGQQVVRMAATHGDRLKGCVALVDNKTPRDLCMLEELSTRLMIGAPSEQTQRGQNGFRPPPPESRDDDNMTIYEYGIPGYSVVKYPKGNMDTLYGWLVDVIEETIL